MRKKPNNSIVKYYNTPAGRSYYVDLEQYIFMLTSDRAYSVVTEYMMRTPYESTAKFQPKETPIEEDAVYSRDYTIALGTRSWIKNFKAEIVKQVKKGHAQFPNPRTYRDYGKGDKSPLNLTNMSFIESVNHAINEYVNNYGPSDPVIVKLERNLYMIAPTDRDSIVIKKVSPVCGVPIVYTPKRFILFRADKQLGAKHIGLSEHLNYQRG